MNSSSNIRFLLGEPAELTVSGCHEQSATTNLFRITFPDAKKDPVTSLRFLGASTPIPVLLKSSRQIYKIPKKP